MSIASELGDAVDDLEGLKVVPLKGAMTNEVFQISWPARKGGGVVRKVLVRIYGQGVELFFNRDDEVKTFECMSNHGQGPRLLGCFADGRVEEFIHARVSHVNSSYLGNSQEKLFLCQPTQVYLSCYRHSVLPTSATRKFLH